MEGERSRDPIAASPTAQWIRRYLRYVRPERMTRILDNRNLEVRPTAATELSGAISSQDAALPLKLTLKARHRRALPVIDGGGKRDLGHQASRDPRPRRPSRRLTIPHGMRGSQERHRGHDDLVIGSEPEGACSIMYSAAVPLVHDDCVAGP